MGAVCCIATKDGTIQRGSNGEILHRNFRHSPTWSFHWDNRVGVADQESSIGWLSDVGTRNDTLDLKSSTDVSARVSDGGSSDYQMSMHHKSPLKHEHTKSLSTCAPGQSHGGTTSLEVKLSASSPTPSFSTLPPTSQSQLVLPSPTSCQWAQAPPSNQVAHQASDSLNSFKNSPAINSIPGVDGLPAAGNESTWGSYGRSSDGWSTNVLPELMSTSQKHQCSFDSNSCSNHDNMRWGGGRNSRLMSMDFQTCGICLKLLTKKSGWSSQKIVAGNDLSVVAVLMCGHTYHAECLETLTPETNKYDPDCPICTYGENQTLKLAGKLKDGIDVKGRCARSRYRVMDNDGSLDFDYLKSPKLNASSSLKIPGAKPFLRRRFSFGSKANRSTSMNTPPIWKKGFSWAKSSRD